jgi:hypothetical protein
MRGGTMSRRDRIASLLSADGKVVSHIESKTKKGEKRVFAQKGIGE